MEHLTNEELHDLFFSAISFPEPDKAAHDLMAEMVKRGLVTRTRPTGGAHPAPGDSIYFAPPLVVTAAEVDRITAAARDSVKAVLGV